MNPTKITLGTFTAACLLFASALQAQTPPNDHCDDVTPGALAIGGTLIFEGNNEGATTTGDNVPGGGLDAFNSAVVWEAFTTTGCATVRISFCGSVAPFLSNYYWNAVATECPANNLVVTQQYNNSECSDGQPVLYFTDLPAGTYYYPVYADVDGPQGDYVLEVTATACGTMPPTADAGPDQVLCSSSNSTTMAANTPDAPATGTWSVVSGSFSIADPSDPNTELTGLAIGENVAAWTVDDGTNTASDQVSIFVLDENNAAADAGPDQEQCGTDAVLAGNVPTFPAPGTWSVVSGTGVFADATDPGTAVSGLSIGENKFAWTVDNSPCANGITADTVTITVIDTTGFVANAGPGLSTCSSVDTLLLQALAPQAPATGSWVLVSGTATIIDINDPQSQITDLGLGENVLAWTVEYSGPCGTGTSSDTLRIVVYDAGHPMADAGPDQELQLPVDHTTLAANAAVAPATGNWALVSGSATIADPADPQTTVTELGTGTNVLRWTLNNGACGTSSDELSITIIAPPGIPELMPGDTLQLMGNNSTAVDSVGLGIPAAWAAFNLGECADVRIDYCAMATPFAMFSNGLYANEPGGSMVLPDSVALCANDSPEQYYTSLQPGIYWVAILMDPEEAMGDYELTVVATACASVAWPNDSCANAQLILPQGSGPIYTAGEFGTLSGATLQPPVPACLDDLALWQDRWYRLEIETDDLVRLELDSIIGGATGLEVFRTCADTSIACSNDGGPIELSGLATGTLVIRVFSQAPDTFLLLVTVDRSTGLHTSIGAEHLVLHPNPGNGNFTMVAPFTAASATLTVRDMSGRIVADHQTTVKAGQPAQVNLQGQLTPGMYLVELGDGVKRYHARFVMQ